MGSEEELVMGGDWGAIDEFEYREGTAVDDYFCSIGQFGDGPSRCHRCLRGRRETCVSWGGR